MNTLEAKRISIHEYLRRKGITPVRHYSCDVAYRAPNRAEKTPSLMVSLDGTMFHDWGGDDGAKGTIIDLAMLLCGTSSIAVALRDIEATMGGIASARCSPASAYTPRTNARRIERYTVGPLQSPALLAYGASRGIPAHILSGACSQVELLGHVGREGQYRYIAWQNRAGGYELRRPGEDPWAKRCLGTKDISVLGEPTGRICLVFEGFFDYMSAVAMGWLPREGLSAIVLNSTALAARAIPLLSRAAEVHLWLDNDASGHQTARLIASALPRVLDCSRFLAGTNDINDFLLSAAKNI